MRKHVKFFVALILLGVFLAACRNPVGDQVIITPTVISTVPADLAIDVAINSNLEVTFSEEMAPETITDASFTLLQGETVVAGTVSNDGVTASFNPTTDLAANTIYSAKVSVLATNLAGTTLAGDYLWSFTTAATVDETQPTVASTVPIDLASNVAINANITASFSEPMDTTTLTDTTFTLKQGSTPVAGSVTYTGTTASFNPTLDLAANTNYTASIGTGAMDLAGNALAAAKTWSFTTAEAPDTTRPLVLSTLPADSATNVAFNSNITALFIEAMDAATLTSTTFTLKQGSTSVAGAVTYTGTTVSFNPTLDLAPSTLYTASISTGATDLAGNALAAAKTWSFTTTVAPDTTGGTVLATQPADSATGIALHSNIIATFSEAMDAASLSTAFTLKQGTTPVPCTVSYSGMTATLDPTAYLAYNTVYTAEIGTDALDLAGNALTAARTWTFTTIEAPDETRPLVSSTQPANSATNVAIHGNITATFSETMAAATLTSATFTLKQGTTPVAGAVSYLGTIATFNPNADLATSTEYTASIGTGATDLAGNSLATAKTWTFTTAEAPDTTAATVISTIPADLETNVAINGNITATFSEAMNAATLTNTTFTLKQGTTPVEGAVSYSGMTATFNPTASLDFNTEYTASIGTGVTDLAGNALVEAETWSFTTITETSTPRAPVDLGSAGNFVILSKSGIDTASALTFITGDIGVSPAAATYITGFSLSADPSNVFSTSTMVDGKVYAANYAVPSPANMTAAVSAMEVAYTNAAGRTDPDFTEYGAGEIGGSTLEPGLYKWGTGVMVTTDVTLSGGPTDVWIFQIGEGLTFANGVNVILEGGALPQNIFWQTFGAVTIGTTVHVEGVILSYTEITLATGASINGRLYSQTAVTLDANAVTQPAD